MTRFPFALKILIVGTALMTELRAAETCPLSAETLTARERHIVVEQQLVKKQIADSEKALKELEGSLKKTQAVGFVSGLIKGMASVVGAIVPGLSAITNWAANTGLPFLEKLLKAAPPKPTSDSGVVLTLDGKKIYARDKAEAQAWIESRIEELERLVDAKGLQLVDHKINFLTNASCVENHECPSASNDVDELFTALGRWFRKAEATGEMQRDFIQLTTRVLKLKTAYYSQLSQALADRVNECNMPGTRLATMGL